MLRPLVVVTKISRARCGFSNCLRLGLAVRRFAVGVRVRAATATVPMRRYDRGAILCPFAFSFLYRKFAFMLHLCFFATTGT